MPTSSTLGGGCGGKVDGEGWEWGESERWGERESGRVRGL